MTTDLTVAPGEHFLFTGEPSPVVQNLLHFSGEHFLFTGEPSPVVQNLLHFSVEHFLFTGEPSPVVQNLLHFSGAVWINRNQRHHPYGYGFC